MFIIQSNNYARTNIYNPGAIDNPNGTINDKTRKPPLEPRFLDLDEERIHAGFNQTYFYLNLLNPNLSTRPRYVTEIITDTIIKVIPGKVIPGYWKTVTVLVPKEITRTETVVVPREVTRTEVITVPKEVTRTETYTVPKEVTRTETYTVPREVTRTETYTVPYTHTYTDYEK